MEGGLGVCSSSGRAKLRHVVASPSWRSRAVDERRRPMVISCYKLDFICGCGHTSSLHTLARSKCGACRARAEATEPSHMQGFVRQSNGETNALLGLSLSCLHLSLIYPRPTHRPHRTLARSPPSPTTILSHVYLCTLLSTAERRDPAVTSRCMRAIDVAHAYRVSHVVCGSRSVHILDFRQTNRNALLRITRSSHHGCGRISAV